MGNHAYNVIHHKVNMVENNKQINKTKKLHIAMIVPCQSNNAKLIDSSFAELSFDNSSLEIYVWLIPLYIYNFISPNMWYQKIQQIQQNKQTY